MSTPRPHRDEGSRGLRIALISVHGLIRGKDLELGRDPDTGGQTLYVVELARALAQQPGVAQVDLFTRRVVDPQVDATYTQPIEKLGSKARIVRIDAGPEEYIRKEELWDHLDAFCDNLMAFLHEEHLTPDVVHGHYADAGFVAQKVAHLLGIPLVQTGHSLGRAKRRRLLAAGLDAAEIEKRYNMSRRIEAEEETLSEARLVITSTQNEIDDQYGRYDNHDAQKMRVVPPGTDLERFHPPVGDEAESEIASTLARFLDDPDRPMILALSRPDERKNISTLVQAYGESPELQKLANLVIVAGTRDDIREMEDGAARVLLDLLLQIDTYDLYGRVAYPKRHRSADVPVLYRLAAASGGVFINPALTEPFGLTLIEAAACGVPLVATEDGGPRDIIQNCRNGILIDPLDTEAMVGALTKLLEDEAAWKEASANGLEGVHRHYSWEAHAQKYLEVLQPVLDEAEARPVPEMKTRPMLYHDRALFTDLDQNLLGDPESLGEFVETIRSARTRMTFGIATGRRLESALRVMRKYGIPQPDVLITSVGTQIHYAPNMEEDSAWSKHIDYLWTPRKLRNVIAELPGLKLQPRSEQSRFKISYYYDAELAPSLDELISIFRSQELHAHASIAFGQYLDLLPIRASKGFALRWFAEHWGIELERILACGGSGTDEDMMRGNTLAAVVANRHDEELSQLVDLDRVYFAERSHAGGILEAMRHYDFLGACRVPEEV